jgi:prepilin-type N-terminal cleavage/methylation domain-containing protein
MEPRIPKTAYRRGFSLLEMLAALTILSVIAASSFPVLRGAIDRFAVLGAREEVAGLFHRARMEAITHGGSRVRARRSPPVLELLLGPEVVEQVDLERSYRTTLTLSRDRPESTLRYDALGLGRVASQTLLFSRGSAEARLTVSAYGRIRRE